jgi:stearoyl-CoA desaturase (Delta-9 desaturase)
LSITAVPLYLWFFGIDWFQIALFFAMLGACGFSITLGYHRLFSHLTFQAHWIVRLFTVIFGAGAFENSVLLWSCEHRSHHKHVDHDEDPYCITKGLFYAHMGWLMFKLKPLPPFDNVADLKKDPILAWQHRYIHLIAVLVAFVLPAGIGFFVGRVESGPRRLTDSGRVTRCGASTLHLLHQFALSLPRIPAVFFKMQCSRLVAPRNPYLR